MGEMSIHCGQNPELIGVFTASEEEGSRDIKIPGAHTSEALNRPTILLLNSGLLPNVGPYRLYVRLARHFSSLGFSSFRFDISGIGDSARSIDQLPRTEQQIRDITVVMDHLQDRHGCERFIVIGICTGADNAHRAMMADRRIVGAVAIDGYYYKTWRYQFNRVFKEYLPKLFVSRTWRTRILGAGQNVLKHFDPNTTENNNPVTVPYRWELPEKGKTESDFRNIVNRNANMLCIFTANWPYNYAEQMADAFPNLVFGSNLQVRYLKNAAHLFPIAEDRQYLTSAISEWLCERFNKG